MRILQVVTLISPDGAYGGPVRVAVNQSRELMRMGHDVLLVGGHSGFSGAPPTSIEGVQTHLFEAEPIVPKAGFGATRAANLGSWLRSHARDFDVAHIHLARDFVTPVAARIVRRAGLPFVLQPHGMLRPKAHWAFRIFDSVLIAPATHAASMVFYLTQRELSDLTAVIGSADKLRFLPNGVPVPPSGPRVQRSDRTTEVLYLSRLHPRKRPELFAAAARDIVADGQLDARFAMVGPDEGALAKVMDEIASVPEALMIEGSLRPEETLERMKSCEIFVLPSVDEPFPMAVLEAMSLGKAVVVTESCGLAAAIDENRAGLVIDEKPASLRPAIERLLRDSSLRRALGANARALARKRFSMNAVGAKLIEVYASVVEGRPLEGGRNE